MRRFISEIPDAVAQYILELTIYKTLRSSQDFKDVKVALNDRTNWLIELFRSCFTIHLTNGSSFFMLSTMTFLVMAESIHILYGRLSPEELKECVESMGYVAFAILFAALDIGFVVVRAAGLVALSGAPGLGASLVLASMLPSVILPLLSYTAKLVKRGRRVSDGEGV